ncbi:MULTISPECIES: hypothetical protein [Glaesserella]|uniref:Uncharacterized protein n=1 Tax=Glaesserella australis TaxID=2094024 RepID=A0A328BZS9_9PAST|nr:MULTISPECIES: hypothetical protein [Glaesserella]AUI65602.1 hypothetical protein CJD39_02985 [Glaesserella sp. 15-184]RAL19111.1 hypothetical protein C5N92_04780 [Glaesserella australis]
MNVNFNEELDLLTKNKNIYFFLGFLAKALFDKNIFNKNETINLFLTKEIKLNLKPYILSSRTLIVAFTIKHILQKGYKENMSVSLYNHILRVTKERENDEPIKIRHRKNKKDESLQWITKILGK